MMSDIWGNIGIFYLLVYLPVAVLSVFSQDIQLKAAGIALAAMVWASWNSATWSSPADMAVFHLLLLTVFAAFLKFPAVKLLFLIVVIDVSWMVMQSFPPSPLWGGFPNGTFWWQSAVNLTFLVLCYITAKGCYTSLNNRSIQRGEQRNANRHNHNSYLPPAGQVR